MSSMNKPLIIDAEFKSLIRPLSEDEFRLLEENIRNDGCLEPIVTWNGRILDGHNRYKICEHWQIPYKTFEMDFPCREKAISWICATQLGRRNISEEMRKYLIGKRFTAEKIISRAQQKRPEMSPDLTQPSGAQLYQLYKAGDIAQAPVKNRTAERIANEYHISHGTVEKYARFSRAIDAISEASPGLAPRILSGECKIAHNNILELSKLKKAEMQRVASSLLPAALEPNLRYRDTRERLQEITPMVPRIKPEIKNMPEPNPDAALTSLILTVPTWENSLQSALTQSDMREVSLQARKKLCDVLIRLKNTVDKTLEIIKE